MKKYNQYLFAILAVLASSCGEFLEKQPQGVVSSDNLNTPENIDKLVITAYSSLGNESIHTSYSLWPWGSLRSDDAYKGGDGPGDNSEWHDYEVFVTNRPTNGLTDVMWAQLYNSIARTNEALSRIDQITEDVYPQKLERRAEMRFLRGNYYFMLKILYKYFPYIDETIPQENYINISNREFSSQELWGKIIDEFRFATEYLPTSQTDPGRPTRYAAQAYLAKTLLYAAYEQDESHRVIAIDRDKLEEVILLCNRVIDESPYGLSDDYAFNFLPEFDNGVESVFATQYSLDDGTDFGRINMGNALIYPMNPEFGCCWQHIPSQDLVNSFKTDENGLPLFDTYNESDVTEGDDFIVQSFDPRLDHTVAIPGHPWKYDPNFTYERSWARAPQTYGYFTFQKAAVSPNDATFQRIPPFMSSSKNLDIIRFADILLWKAEALIELERQGEAMKIINQLRQRASNSTDLLVQADGSATSNYDVGIYPLDVSQEYARRALRWERRLEFAMEGNRLFDLVRWGIAAEMMNQYFKEESSKRSYLESAEFQEGRDEYLPIPINQINFSKGLYEQNTGW